jgi:Holliday junction DNA helicase RuvB
VRHVLDFLLLCELVLVFLLDYNITAELLTTIVERSIDTKMPISMEAAIEIAGRSRNTAYSECFATSRTWFCTNKGNGTIDIEIARYALKALNVDAHGLDEMDNKILNTIIDKFGVQLACLLSYCCFWKYWNNRRGIWTFLIQEGFIMRTPRGREVTDKAYRHLGKVNWTFKVVCFKFIKYRFQYRSMHSKSKYTQFIKPKPNASDFVLWYF